MTMFHVETSTAADIARDLADQNGHEMGGGGLIPVCTSCGGSGVDGPEDDLDECRSCKGTARETCECGEPSLRYEHYRAEVYGDGGAVVMGTCREPRCFRCCKQSIGLVGPLTGYEPDPDAPPDAWRVEYGHKSGSKTYSRVYWSYNDAQQAGSEECNRNPSIYRYSPVRISGMARCLDGKVRPCQLIVEALAAERAAVTS